MGPYGSFESRMATLPPETDVDLAVEQLVGPIYYRVLVAGQPVPAEFTDRLVDQFLAQISPPG